MNEDHNIDEVLFQQKTESTLPQEDRKAMSNNKNTKKDLANYTGIF